MREQGATERHEELGETRQEVRHALLMSSLLVAVKAVRMPEGTVCSTSRRRRNAVQLARGLP